MHRDIRDTCLRNGDSNNKHFDRLVDNFESKTLASSAFSIKLTVLEKKL